jgi:hypothetical protein
VTASEYADNSGLFVLFDQLSDGIAVALPGSRRLLYVSPILAGWLGKVADELRDTPLEDLFRPESRAAVLELADRVCQGGPATAVATAHLEGGAAPSGATDVRLCRLSTGEQMLLGAVVRERHGSRANPAIEARRDDRPGGSRISV